MRWGTVTLADEPLALLMAFAAWHRQAGAAEIHIFLDRAHGPDAEALARIPGTRVRVCDDGFWTRHGGRPKLQTRRQEIVANAAYGESDVPWLAHIDADEFIHPGPGFADELAAIPAAVDGTTLPVRERVWEAERPPRALFDGLYRVPIPGKLPLNRVLHPETARYRYRGLTSHTTGKTLVRTGREIAMGIHTPREQDRLHLMHVQGATLLHFDGLTPFHWLVKRLKYAALPHAQKRMDGENYRWAQIEALRAMPTLWEARRFQRRLSALHPEKIAELAALRLLEDAAGFDPAAALARFPPGVPVDLSVAHFDAEIAARDADFVSALSLAPEPGPG
ncbi:MAG: glycosyltransferase family 2 protein [Pseudomonadota bacterium]